MTSSFRCKCGYIAFVNVGEIEPDYRCCICYHELRNTGSADVRIPQSTREYLKQEKEYYDRNKRKYQRTASDTPVELGRPVEHKKDNEGQRRDNDWTFWGEAVED